MGQIRPPSGKSVAGGEARSPKFGGEPEEVGNWPPAAHSLPWWREWLRDYDRSTDPECIALIDLVYAIGDLHTRAQGMRLDFLGYLLGMAFQEALEQLRARDAPDYPSPPAA